MGYSQVIMGWEIVDAAGTTSLGSLHKSKY
jgi:hypothetical protein